MSVDKCPHGNRAVHHPRYGVCIYDIKIAHTTLAKAVVYGYPRKGSK